MYLLADFDYVFEKVIDENKSFEMRDSRDVAGCVIGLADDDLVRQLERDVNRLMANLAAGSCVDLSKLELCDFMFA